MSAPLLLTASQAAALLGLCPFDVLGLVESGELPAGKIGGRWVMRPRDLAAYADTLVGAPSYGRLVPSAVKS